MRRILLICKTKVLHSQFSIFGILVPLQFSFLISFSGVCADRLYSTESKFSWYYI